MKSFKKVALAAAVAAVAAGNAFAAVNLDTGAGLVSYSRELASSGQALSGAGVDVAAPLGFGVSNGQTRYVRFDLGNATFNGAAAGALTGVDITSVQSAGGTAGGSYIIFQITATANVPSSALLTYALGSPGITVTSAASNVTVSYSLYENASDAVAGGSAGRLANLSNKSVAAFVKSTVLTVTPASALTAEVTADYKTFVAPNSAFGKLADVRVGLRDFDAGTPGLQVAKTPAGADVVFGDLYGAGSVVTLVTDASLASASSVRLRVGACSALPAPGDIVGTISGSTAAFEIDATIGEDENAWNLCYINNGTTAIAKQDFTLSGNYQPVGGPSGPRADNEAAQAAGSIVRNGTLLKGVFPEVASNTGYALSVHLNNQSASAVPFTTVCYTQSTKVNGLPGSVAGNTAQRVGLNSASGLGCPNGTRAVELTMGVRTGTVIGSVVRQNTTTGVASFESMLGSQESSPN